MHEVVAALGIADEMLTAVGDPFDRAPELLGSERAERIFAIDEGLGAEAAADIGRDHAKAPLVDLEAAGDGLLERVAALGTERDGPAPVALVIGGNAVPRLEGVRHEAVVHEPQG